MGNSELYGDNSEASALPGAGPGPQLYTEAGAEGKAEACPGG